MITEARQFTAAELQAGMKADFEADITETSVANFAAVSGDFNPLHMDHQYARNSNFGGRVVHGAYQVGLASAMAGMYMPGRKALVASANARFPQPLHYPTRVRVKGEITTWNPESLWGSLRVLVEDLTSRLTTAEITIGFTFHDEPQRVSMRGTHPQARAADRPAVLITGAAGGLGSALVRNLSDSHSVFAVTSQTPLADDLRSKPGVTEVHADLTAPGWEDEIAKLTTDCGLYGVVHAAWPGVPLGGLLDLPDDLLTKQVMFGSAITLRLARLMAGHATSNGGRIVVISSIYGSIKPVLAMAAYSLGKNTMEQIVRLLAPELARHAITINAVAPSYIPVGINKEATDRQRLREAASIPLNRLCETDDVFTACKYLLSPEAAFISGQVIGLTGAQL